jgi:hypothetical protein
MAGQMEQGLAWVLSVIAALFIGGFLRSYMSKKGENLATHEDINKLIDQVAAVTTTTKRIEANISTEMWQRERKSDLQLKVIDSVNALTSHFLQHSIDDPKYVPNLEWFTSFRAVSASVRALFDEETYAKFKNLEIRIGPGMSSEGEHPLVASEKFVEASDVALKAMYSKVIGSG